MLKAAALLPLLPPMVFSWLPLHRTSPGVVGACHDAAHGSDRKPIYQRKNLGACELCLLVLTLWVPGLWWLQPLQQCCVLPRQFTESHRLHWDPQRFLRAKNIWRFTSTLFLQGLILYSLQKWHSVYQQRLERAWVKPAACVIVVREHYSVFNKWQACSLPYPRLCEKGVV